MTPPLELTLRYACAADLAAHLAEQPGALLVRVGNPQELAAYPDLVLYVRLPDAAVDVPARLLQALDGLGLVVQPLDPAALTPLVQGATPSAPAAPPVVSGGRPDTKDDETNANEQAKPDARVAGAELPKGSTVLSWPIEKLQTEWHSLSIPEKIRVAKHGKRPARLMVMRMQDKKLHAFLLRNPKIGVDEIATMAGMVQLDPALLRQIAMTPEWVRHTNVARALVSHPKLPTQLIQKLLPSLSVDEARRLTKGGRVRASVKRLLMKKIERGR
jgi:hypothetical protein